MFTSNFSKDGHSLDAVSICRNAPLFFTGRTYKKLAPSYDISSEYKRTGDRERYTERYTNEVLSKLDPQTVYDELGPDAVLLCHENGSIFCHRHLVARWLNKNLNLNIEER